MAAPAHRQPHLTPVPDAEEPVFLVVHPTTGETRPLPEILQPYEDHIAGLQRDVKAEHLRYENLKRDKEREAEGHPLWPDAMKVFSYWKEKCNHPRSAWSPDRFEQIRPFLERHDVAICKRAVDGAAFDPFVTTRKNGSKKRHDGWGLIFRASEPDKFEEFCNKAPKGGT
jgi:hypothetical protein